MAASTADAFHRRREKRRQLDARRSKCRIRLGGHMEQWCLLKERLGFSLHSQLAKFLLDRYTSEGCVLCAGPKPLPPKGLQYLVLLSHAHSQECSLVPGLREPGGRDGGLVWECSAGHTFSWGPSSGPTPPAESKPALLPSTSQRSWCPEARGGQEPTDLRVHLLSSLQPKVASTLTPPVPTGLESEHEKRTQEARLPRGIRPPPAFFLPPGEDEGGDEDESEEEMLSDASPWTYSSSSDNCEPDGPRLPPFPVTHALKEGEVALAPAAAPTSLAGPPFSAPAVSPGVSLPVEGRAELEVNQTPQAAQQSEPLASPGSRAQSSLVIAWDKDSAQIGPKRIRKAANKELLPCDFPGCGRIFSNRQYLNHHKKYQHIHQKSFSCPEPACGKSFNFKKHLKEHVKLHSDTRDYICEFCARSFRTSSNLVIHQRIHTGEKPLQCEICGFTCRQKASLNWHQRKHAETAATLRFPCKVCGKCFEKPDSVAAHCSKSHPAVLLATSEQLGPVEPCPSISAPALLGSRDECRPPRVLQALALLPKQ
ncbi:zinc finger protein 692 isoform X1 [Desmodus rotundus]|uniref:zinc finger protein 692 isoform X1 n=1 Tax=Desmodus rotundus TaxID=9430 RepID=UPI00238107A8|nr:zinc finger protein 692 isoform X1 [Desmodus rotundus]XP_053766739.1 zinc finger protein 692 isoform X1 [Desmodus rotundus]